MHIAASVVIPTFKRPALLFNCLRSLLVQSVTPDCYEIIVVTDGPDSVTTEMVKRLQERCPKYPALRLVSLPHHKGPAAARNLGWKKARARLIIFTDDDCIPAENFIEAYLAEFHRVQWPCVAYTGVVKVPVGAPPSDYERNISQLEQASFITANCALSVQALETTGGFDEDFTMAWREDSAMEFCLIKHQIPICLVPGALVLHPVRKARWGVSLYSEKKNMFNALLYKKHTEMYKRKIRSKPPLLYYAILVAALGVMITIPAPPAMFVFFLLCWLVLTTILIQKRLRGTSKHPSHITEIVFTSMFIPALSVFWNSYGCIRYKSLLL